MKSLILSLIGIFIPQRILVKRNSRAPLSRGTKKTSQQTGLLPRGLLTSVPWASRRQIFRAVKRERHRRGARIRAPGRTFEADALQGDVQRQAGLPVRVLIDGQGHDSVLQKLARRLVEFVADEDRTRREILHRRGDGPVSPAG